MAAPAINVLITGANRGLGLEMVKQILESHRPVRKLFACCRDPDGPRAEALRALAKKHPDVVHIIRLDASDLCSIKRSAQQVGSVVGAQGLNLLINNAGHLSRSNLQESKPEDMHVSFNTNLLGPLYMIQEYLPQLRAAVKASQIRGMSVRKAAVVNISTFLASNAFVEKSYDLFSAIPYRVSKAGLNMLTSCAAEEMKKEGILFVSLHPGWVRTEMGGERGEIDSPESVEGMLKVMASMTEKQNGSFLDYKGETLPW